MRGVKQNLEGQRFGRLVVLQSCGRKKSSHRTVWLCQCDCGKQTEVGGDHLKDGSIRSCGCLSREYDVGRSKAVNAHNAKHERKDNTCLCSLTAKTYSNNTSGRKGVSFHKRRGKWVAHIYCQGKPKYLGCYTKFEDAVKAREQAEEELFEPILNAYGRSLYEKEVR